jgi:hypothetical protein
MHKLPLYLNATIYPHTTIKLSTINATKAFPCAQPNTTTIYMPPPKFKLPFAKKKKKNNSWYLIAQNPKPM